MKLSELLKTIQPVQVTGSTEKDITGVNIDSRKNLPPTLRISK